jgi:NADH-quinone oxidoreductase subunit A
MLSTAPSILGQATPVMTDPRANWTPIVVLLVIAIGFALVNVAASIILGPRREGAFKGTTYESGMTPVGDTRRRFNVRFYVVAMIFLVIDVEIIFFYPWATIFAPYSMDPAYAGFGGVLLVEILIFVLLLLLAYVYAWGKGVFRWD